MVTRTQGRELASEMESFGLLTEGTAGIVVIVVSIIALAGVSAQPLAAIAAIVIGGGMMAQAFNSAAEHLKTARTGSAAEGAANARRAELGTEILVDGLCGFAGIVLGILSLVGVGTARLLPAALIVYGGELLVGGFASAGNLGAFASAGVEVLIGLAAAVLGILGVVMAGTPILVLVGFLVVGVALVLVSATCSGAVLQLLEAH